MREKRVSQGLDAVLNAAYKGIIYTTPKQWEVSIAFLLKK